jgi:hypothetical protein
MSATQRLAGLLEAHGSVKPGAARAVLSGWRCGPIVKPGVRSGRLLLLLSHLFYRNTNPGRNEKEPLRSADAKISADSCAQRWTRVYSRPTANNGLGKQLQTISALPFDHIKNPACRAVMHNNQINSLSSASCA